MTGRLSPRASHVVSLREATRAWFHISLQTFGGPAGQLAVYVGWLLNGMVGGLVAGILFVLPGLVALLALSAVYAGFGETMLVAGIFAGLAPAVVAVVVQAVLRIGRRVLHHPALVALAVAAFAALALFGLAFPL